jgi:predicted GIY-YIG superfamily endonuclease
VITAVAGIYVVATLGVTWYYGKISNDLSTSVKKHNSRSFSFFIKLEDFVKAVLTRNSGSRTSV